MKLNKNTFESEPELIFFFLIYFWIPYYVVGIV